MLPQLQQLPPGAMSSCGSYRSSSNRSNSYCRQILSRSNSLEVGVLGGSISWGAELENILEERYSALLQTRLRPQVAARVHNFAMPSTGSGYASFCIDQIVPRDVNVLIIEFNFNDAFAYDVFAADRDSTAQSPSLSFERLIRNALSRPSPPWLIIVLGVCQRWLKCEQIHRAVTLHYAAQGVMSVSLNRDGVRLPMSLHHNGSHHPTRAGHAEIARLIERAIMERSRCCHTWSRLPPSSWERCARSAPFSLEPGVSPYPIQSCAPRQVGWTATEPNSTVAFQVSGGQSGASFLLAMLCSYENVGNASVRFTSRDNGLEAAERVLEMRWDQNSSQQCIHHVGRVGPGDHTLHVTALSSPGDPWRGSNQVKLFGIYSQMQRSPTVLLKVPAAEEQLVAAEEKFKAEEAAFDAAVAAETVVHSGGRDGP